MTKTNGQSAPSRRSFIKGAGVLAAGVAAPSILRVRSAYAAYPDRPVKIIVANTPGGPSDIVGRITAGALQQSTGKTFIIENIGGAGGNIGFGNAAHAAPDGYTILLATNAWSVNVSLYNKIPYDPLKDFVGCQRACNFAQYVRRQVGFASEDHAGIRCARASQSR